MWHPRDEDVYMYEGHETFTSMAVESSPRAAPDDVKTALQCIFHVLFTHQ
jgi:hypothetical protein